MNYRPVDSHSGAPVDEYWELLRQSLRSALGRPAGPDAPERAADEGRPQTPPAPPAPAGLPSDQAVDRYGWAM
jgi:hypothetical protein